MSGLIDSAVETFSKDNGSDSESSFKNIDGKSTREKNEFRWHMETAGLNVGLILAVIPREIYDRKYNPNNPIALSKKLADEVSERLLALTEDLIKQLHETLFQVAEFHEELLKNLEETLTEQIEQIKDTDPETANNLRGIKEDVSSLRDDVAEQKNELEEVAKLPKEPKEDRLRWYQRLGKRSVQTTEKIEQVVEDIKEAREPPVEPVEREESPRQHVFNHELQTEPEQENPFAAHEARLNELVSKIEAATNNLEADAHQTVDSDGQDDAGENDGGGEEETSSSEDEAEPS